MFHLEHFSGTSPLHEACSRWNMSQSPRAFPTPALSNRQSKNSWNGNSTEAVMNENPDAFNDEVVTPQPDPPKPHWREWCRRFFICNPFFLCSAALLLLAINRLS